MEKTKKILVVDDDETFCSFIKTSLEILGGFEVSVCCNAMDAVKRVEKNQPDLILLDVMMPNLSGSEIAEKLEDNDNTRNIPIVFLTALISEEEMADRDGIIGKHHYISKSTGVKKLIEIINRLFI